MEFLRLPFINGFKNTLNKKYMNPSISIGRIIQEEAFQMNVSLHELSDRMFLTEKTLLLLFNSKSIEMSLLYRWSCVMNINLFEIYSEYLSDSVYAIDVETMTHSYNHNHVQKFINEDEI
jgi:hypothetical protein